MATSWLSSSCSSYSSNSLLRTVERENSSVESIFSAGDVQVYHRLQVLEEEAMVRKVEQEVEKVDQSEENARMTMHMEMT